MAVLKYLIIILALVSLSFSFYRGHDPQIYEWMCENRGMQQHINSSCSQASTSGCQAQSISERNMCWRTYTCTGMADRDIHLAEKCAVVCTLMRHSVRQPADQVWGDRIIPGTEVRMALRYHWSSQVETRTVSSNIKSWAYDFFWKVYYLQFASITYTPRDCAFRYPDNFTQCRVELRNNTQVRQLCTNPTMAFCRREALDRQIDNHCSRSYRCDGLTEDVGQDEIRKCGLLCWVFEHAFMDFPHGNTPVNETTFDFHVHTKSSNNTDEWNEVGNLVDVSLEDARRAFYSFLHHTFNNQEYFDVKVQVASRHCFLEKPPTCRARDYLNYQAGRRMFLDQPAGCTLPSRLDARYAFLVDDGTVTLPPSNECSVFVQCNFTNYFQTHGWKRLDWCWFMDWMFLKTISWLGLGSRAESSDMQTTISIFYGWSDSDGDQVFEGRGKTLPLKSALAFYENIMFSASGYIATNFVINQVFQNCLQETNGSAEINIQGEDYCPNNGYVNPPRITHMDDCHLNRGVGMVSCDFVPAHSLEHKCDQLYWMIHNALYSRPHQERRQINITMQATASNGETSTRTLSPIRRDRAVPYIKNFVVNIFNTMTMFRIDVQFP